MEMQRADASLNADNANLKVIADTWNDYSVFEKGLQAAIRWDGRRACRGEKVGYERRYIS